MQNRLRDWMLYSAGSSTKQVHGGEPYSKAAGIQHSGCATEEMIAEMQEIVGRQGDTPEATQHRANEPRGPRMARLVY